MKNFAELGNLSNFAPAIRNESDAVWTTEYFLRTKFFYAMSKHFFVRQRKLNLHAQRNKKKLVKKFGSLTQIFLTLHREIWGTNSQTDIEKNEQEAQGVWASPRRTCRTKNEREEHMKQTPLIINKEFIQRRVWSWLRINASGRPNTCKSRGNAR